VKVLLVKHAVDGDGGLSGLTVTNDKLALSTSNWDKTVDGLKTGLHGLVHGLAGQDTWGLDFYTLAGGGVDGAFAVDGLSKTVDNTA